MIQKLQTKAAAEPLVVRAAIVAAITGIVHMLVVLGVLPISPDQEDAIASAVDLAGTAIAVVWGRASVSPASKHEPRHSATSEPSEAVSVDESAESESVSDPESEGASA